MVTSLLTSSELARLAQSSKQVNAMVDNLPIHRDIAQQEYKSLCYACIHDQVEVVATVLSLGGDKNVTFCRRSAKRPAGMPEDDSYVIGTAAFPGPNLHSGPPCSALGKAVRADSSDVVEFLIQNGARCTEEYQNPLTIRPSGEDVVDHVPHPSLMPFVRSDKVYDILKQAGAANTINDVGINGYSVIEIVLVNLADQPRRQRDPKQARQLIKRLIESGAHVQSRDSANLSVPFCPPGVNLRSSPLMVAVTLRSPPLCRLLLAHYRADLVPPGDTELQTIFDMITGIRILIGRPGAQHLDMASPIRKQLMSTFVDGLGLDAESCRELCVRIIGEKNGTLRFPVFDLLFDIGYLKNGTTDSFKRLVWAILSRSMCEADQSQREIPDDIFTTIRNAGADLNANMNFLRSQPIQVQSFDDSVPPALFLSALPLVPAAVFEHLLSAGCSPHGEFQVLSGGSRYTLAQCLFQLYALNDDSTMPWGLDPHHIEPSQHQHLTSQLTTFNYKVADLRLRKKLDIIASTVPELLHLPDGTHVFSWALRELHGTALELAMYTISHFPELVKSMAERGSSFILDLLNDERCAKLLSFGDLSSVQYFVQWAQEIGPQVNDPPKMSKIFQRLCRLDGRLGSRHDWDSVMHGDSISMPFAFSPEWYKLWFGEGRQVSYDQLERHKEEYEWARRQSIVKIISEWMTPTSVISTDGKHILVDQNGIGETRADEKEAYPLETFADPIIYNMVMARRRGEFRFW